MNTSTTIIGLVILGLFILPFILISKSKKKKIEQLKNFLTDEAKKIGVTISDIDYWNDSALGIDDIEETFIFINENHDEKEVRVFNINEMKSVRFIPDITKKNSKIDYKKEQKLCISILFKESVKSEVNLVFFTAGFGYVSRQEQELFEKWTNKIKKLKAIA